MNIIFLSGKGGTGKTLVSTNLAAVVNKGTYYDCDVEEPNGHLFFKPTIEERIDVVKQIPVFDLDRCVGCRECVDFCRFNALAMINNRVWIQESLCHGCGGCSLICKHGAVSEKNHENGHIDKGRYRNMTVLTGWMNVMEEAATPIIETMLALTSKDSINFIDCPPGASCSVMACVEQADYAIIVAEPTLYGLENMKMIIELLEQYHKPMGIVLNQVSDSNDPVTAYLNAQSIPILTKIPYDNNIAIWASNGQLAVMNDSNYHSLFSELFARIQKEELSWNG